MRDELAVEISQRLRRSLLISRQNFASHLPAPQQIVRTVVPTKINEYLATGKPVVSTDIPTVCEFNEEHRILITSPAESESFVRAIEQALMLPTDAATVRHRRRVAEQGDWGKRLEEMSRLIEKLALIPILPCPHTTLLKSRLSQYL